MKKLLFLILCTAAGSVSAQPWPRQERFTLDNTKRMTDASVSLFNVHSDYDFPYVIPAREDVTEKLVRILDYLEGATASPTPQRANGLPTCGASPRVSSSRKAISGPTPTNGE